MLNEAITLWKRALEDGTIGINAQLPSVPRFSSHAQPELIAKVYATTEDDDVAFDRLPPDWPSLIVSAGVDSAFRAEGEVFTGNLRDADGGQVTTLYATADGDLAQAQRDAYYVMRGCARVAREWLRNANIGMRTANEIVLRSASEMAYGPLFDRIEGGVITGAFSLTLTARDKAP